MDSKNIFVWSPFTSKIGTINNVINSSYSLIKFSKLKNFNDSKANKLNKNQNKTHPVRYTMSDNKHFNKIVNVNNSNDSLPKKTEKIKKNNYYSSIDLENFNKLQKFATFNNNETKNKKSEVVKNKFNYTAKDVGLSLIHI